MKYLLLFFCCTLQLHAQTFGPYAEPAMPFLESVVDFRDWEKQGFPKENLVVRGVILKLRNNIFVCYDTDLLRVAGIWEGDKDGNFLTFTSIASISYNTFNKKSEPGQKDLPKPIGKPLAATGRYFGWTIDGKVVPDPRPVPADARELGRGPVPREMGRWLGVDHSGTVHYEIQGKRLLHRWTVKRTDSVASIYIERSSGPSPVLDQAGIPTPVELKSSRLGSGMAGYGAFLMAKTAAVPVAKPHDVKSLFAPKITTTATLADNSAAYAIDDISLPLANPWKRNVRMSGMDFFPDGRAVLCTLDGDIWIASGLSGDLAKVTWQRIASGLGEPQSVAVVNGKIYTFTRNGIIKLHLGKDGVCERYETFCNAYIQTAETREYPMDMVKKPGGGFYICKGGQQLTNKGDGAGRIYEVSADGRTVTEVCNGLRQPYLGIHPKTGVLSASDQQGNYIPTSPIHLVQPGAFYGYPDAAPAPTPPIVTEATCWIPHELNQSAAGQVWAVNSKLGSLEGHLLHLAYFKSAVFEAFLPEDGKQAAVVPMDWKLDIPLLKGSIHPVDGSLYLCGLQIWGADAKKISGLKRVRTTGKPNPQPTNVRAVAEGVVLTFAEPLDEFSLAAPGAFIAQRWNYKRSKDYGSAHYKLDGTPGHEFLPVVGAVLSQDARSVFLRLDNMAPVMQLQVEWNVKLASGIPCKNLAEFTIRSLEKLDFAAARISPAIMQAPGVSAETADANFTPTAEAGHHLALQMGCLSCHSIDGKMEGMKGPSWFHSFGGEALLTTGKTVSVDAAYIKESILTPTAKVRKGFANPDTGMPPYLGILSDRQIEAIILYFKSLAAP